MNPQDTPPRARDVSPPTACLLPAMLLAACTSGQLSTPPAGDDGSPTRVATRDARVPDSRPDSAVSASGSSDTRPDAGTLPAQDDASATEARPADASSDAPQHTPDATSTDAPPPVDARPDTRPPDSAPDAAPPVTGSSCADFPHLLMCQDFHSYAEYQGMLWLHDNMLTAMHRASGGWDDGPFLRLRINDYDGEHGAGIAPGPLERPVIQFNVGYMIRYGSNYGPALDREEHKHLLVVDGQWWHGSGVSVARPMIQDSPFIENGQYRYRTVTPCSTAGGGCSFPPLTGEPHGPDPAWIDGWPDGNEPFRIDDHVEQWIYYEAQIVAGGRISLYIYTRDGQFNGLYHSVPAMDGMEDIGGIDVLSYWEGASNTDDNTYMDIDFLRLSTQFMGPPAGFMRGGR